VLSFDFSDSTIDFFSDPISTLSLAASSYRRWQEFSLMLKLVAWEYQLAA
jgi:hypothetical protein